MSSNAVAANPNQPVDIDELEVDILFLCKNPKDLQSTANFLTRRGWPTQVESSLSKAIDIIVKTSPDFVLISCNHPNPNTIRLPKLLGSAVTSQAVAFAEQNDAASNAKLGTVQMDHKLQGGVSGPNVHRFIRKILQKMYNPEQADDENKSSKLENKGDDKITVTGGNKSNKNDNANEGKTSRGSGMEMFANEETESFTATQKGNSGSKRKKLKDLTGSAKTGEGVNVNETKSSKELLALMNEDKGVNSQNAGAVNGGVDNIGYSTNSSMHGAGNASEMAGAAGADAGAVNQGANAGNYGAVASTSGEGLGAAMAGGSGTNANRAGDSRMGANANSGVHSNGESAEASELNAGELSGEETEASGEKLPARPAYAKPHLSRAPKKKRKARGITKIAKKQDGESSEKTAAQIDLLEKVLNETLKKICPVEEEPDHNLDDTKQLGIVEIEAKDFFGYIIVAATRLRDEALQSFLDYYCRELMASLVDNKLEAKIEEGFVAEIEELKFLEWAEAEAEIGLLGNYKDDEIATVFLPMLESRSAPQVSDKREMATVALKDIEAEVPVTFKTYLHFKKADRYFLYVRNGRSLGAKQKENLNRSKVENLFIKAIDIRNYKSYKAKNDVVKNISRRKNKKTG